MMKLPDFIILGNTKCGTTALWYNLDKHPDITMATKSKTSIEMNFFTRKINDFEWYKSKFNGDGLNGEKSTGCSEKKSIMRKIKKTIPDAKLILCVRNPIDRAYSNWQMNNASGKVLSPFTYNLFLNRYKFTGLFINHIEKNILPFFDKTQLYICVAEHMKKEPTKEMKKVFEYLGVNDLNYPSKIIEYMKGRTRFEDITMNREEKFYRVWSKFKKQLTGSLRNEIIEFYKPYNKQLYDFLGYKIKEWDK